MFTFLQQEFKYFDNMIRATTNIEWLAKKIKSLLQILVIIKIIVQIFLMNIYFFLHL
jgi:hypothetical protein